MNDQLRDAIEEAGLRPSLEYLHGYLVVGVEGKTIEFEGGAFVVADDDFENLAGESLVGLRMITTIYRKQSTSIMFGRMRAGEITDNVRIELPPKGYDIIDSRFKTTMRPADG